MTPVPIANLHCNPRNVFTWILSFSIINRVEDFCIKGYMVWLVYTMQMLLTSQLPEIDSDESTEWLSFFL